VDAFSDGVGEEVAVALREFEGLVIAPNVCSDREAVSGHVSHVVRRAGADLVLFGDVRRSDDDKGVFITATLFDGRSGRCIWSGASAARRRADAGTVASPAREIARAVARALGTTRLTGRIECATTPTRSFTSRGFRTGTDELR
jgi:TolB-like protein